MRAISLAAIIHWGHTISGQGFLPAFKRAHGDRIDLKAGTVRKARPAVVKAYARSVVALLLMMSWSVAAFTRFLLWLASQGARSGHVPLLFGLTKHDWRALCACVRYLTSSSRPSNLSPQKQKL